MFYNYYTSILFLHTYTLNVVSTELHSLKKVQFVYKLPVSKRMLSCASWFNLLSEIIWTHFSAPPTRSRPLNSPHPWQLREPDHRKQILKQGFSSQSGIYGDAIFFKEQGIYKKRKSYSVMLRKMFLIWNWFFLL